MVQTVVAKANSEATEAHHSAAKVNAEATKARQSAAKANAEATEAHRPAGIQHAAAKPTDVIRLEMKASAESPAQVKVLEPTEAGDGVGATAKAHWPNQAAQNGPKEAARNGPTKAARSGLEQAQRPTKAARNALWPNQAAKGGDGASVIEPGNSSRKGSHIAGRSSGPGTTANPRAYRSRGPRESDEE